jgi:PAS domain S-box-containing protein
MKNQNGRSVTAADLRLQAETMARENAPRLPEDLETMSPEAIRQALHELRVYQIELEMQNEELRRAQRELDEVRIRYFDLYDLAPVGYCTIGENGLIQEANLTIASLLGVTRNDLVKSLVSPFIIKEDQDIYYKFFIRLFQTDAPQECELRMVKKDGTEFWAHLAATTAQDADGYAVCRMVLGDITARKLAEESLLAGAEKFRTLAELAPVGIYLTDPAGNCEYANPAWCKMAGMTQAEALGQGWINGLHPEDRARIFASWQAMVSARTRWELEYRFLNRDGGVTVVYGLATPQHDASGRIVRYVGVNTDITERKQAESEVLLYRNHLEELVALRTVELVESRDQAQAANRAKSIFLANMSHELRTPLTAVLGFSEIVSLDPAIPSRARENLLIVLRSGEHLLALINDILDLAKIDAGRVEIELHDVDLGELIDDVMNMTRGRAETKGLRLILDQASHFPRFVTIDPGKLRQIIVNLVGNAIKFTQTGQITIKMTTEDTSAGQVLSVEVRDTGIGISRADQERIFLPFEQAMTQVSGGTGLGLAITRQYVQMLGGRIAVDSRPGEGSCFSFTIPAGRVNTDTVQELSIHRHPVRIASPTADLRILIVEDQPDNRLLFKCFLKPLKFQLCEATNGQEAVTVFQEWRPHLIFMDRRMPVMDGLEATRQIRALPGGTDTVIIAVSAHSYKEEQREMLVAGCSDFLSKPFGEDDLLILLKKHLHLELVYADDKIPQPLTANDLRVLCPAALASLRQLATECDDVALTKWLAAQTVLAPVAREALAGLINDYRFEEIQKLAAPLVVRSQ